MNRFTIKWYDAGREPQSKPDPRYPKGIDLDITKGLAPNCTVTLPYPAKRCGHYYVECKECGTNAVVTTAGRVDDPRSLKLPCKGGAVGIN